MLYYWYVLLIHTLSLVDTRVCVDAPLYFKQYLLHLPACILEKSRELRRLSQSSNILFGFLKSSLMCSEVSRNGISVQFHIQNVNEQILKNECILFSSVWGNYHKSGRANLHCGFFTDFCCMVTLEIS